MGTLGKTWKSNISDARRKQIIATNKRVFTGKKLTPEHKDKIKKNNSKYWSNKKRPEVKDYFTMKGKHHSIGSRQKIKINNSRYWSGKQRPPLSEKHRDILRQVNMNNQYTKGKKVFRVGHQNTTENEKARNSIEIRLWKKACMERDSFTCQKTGVTGGRIEVHHINNFADFPELRTSIENGITLSIAVHKEFHKLYGKRNNSREQLIEFLNK